MYVKNISSKIKKVLIEELNLPKCDVKEEAECTSLDFLLDNTALRITIRERSSKQGYISKILPILDYTDLLQSCRESEYTPYGLYVISETLDDFILKLKDKTSKILKYLRRSL